MSPVPTKKLRRRDRLREDLFDRVEETGHHVIDWIPLTASTFFAAILHLARSKWIPDTGEMWVVLVRAAFLVAEAVALLTMVGPQVVEAIGTLVELGVIRYHRVRSRLQGREPDGEVKLEDDKT